ncbi:MAG: protoporphyrinogen oxidase [Opitutaceae bacterium]|nr:protoporphyrinogen oxidase [Opitutaceae bacterium]
MPNYTDPVVNPAPTRSIAIIGAGITGLTAAFRLHQRGFAVQVFEQAAYPGGSIRTIREAGYLIEGGPNTLMLGAAEAKQLIRDAGLEPTLQVANTAAKKRFIVRDGRFMPVPMGPGSFFTTKLFSARTKAAIFGELLARRRQRSEDVSLATLVAEHFTPELVDYALNPLIAGIYAGDPAQLSVRHAFPTLLEAERSHGSLLRGLIAGAKARKARGETRAQLVSFPDGLQALPNALAAKLPAEAVHYGAVVEAVIPGPPHRLVWTRYGQTSEAAFDDVILALPAGALAQLVIGTARERPLAVLNDVLQPPVSSLFLGYRREQVGHPLDGFGGLVPAIERRSVLGILFSSTLFPGRAPEGHVGLTVFAGGMRQPELARLDTDALLAQIARDLHDLVGVSTPPLFVRHSYWPRAIPQYTLGYERFLGAIERLEQEVPGLHVGGNVRDGISLQDCIKAGERLARSVAGK